MIRAGKFVIISACLMVLFSLAVPGLRAADSAGFLRLVQTAPDAPAVDIFINGQKRFSGLNYQGVSSYMNLPSGNYDIKVFKSPSTGSGTPLLNVPGFNINGNSVNTLVITGQLKDNSLSALPLNDASWVADPGKAKVRFIHASPDAPAIDISVAGLGKVFNNISFKGVGNYMDAPAGSLRLEAATTQNATPVLTKDISLEQGKVYTVYAVGLVQNKSVNALISVDNTAPVVAMPSTGFGGTSQHNPGLELWMILILATVSLGGVIGLSYLRKKL